MAKPGSDSIVKTFYLLFLSILIVFSYPLLFSLFAPILFYRYVITKLVQQQDPKVGNIVSGTSAIYMAHKTYSKPANTILTYFTLSSKPDINRITKMYDERVIQLRNSQGAKVYPEFRQRIISKYGYKFWYDVDNFDINNHFRYWNSENPNQPITRTEVTDEVVKKLTTTPFNPAMSPWECIIIPNLIDEEDPAAKALVLFRCHHGLMDGFSCLKVIRKLSIIDWKEDYGNKFKFPQMSIFEKATFILKILVMGPYHVLKSTHFSVDNNEWVRRSVKEHVGIARIKLMKSEKTERLNKIARHYNVSVSSIICTVMLGAVARMMKREERRDEELETFKAHVFMSYPLPGHPNNKLVNHWSAANLSAVVFKNDLPKTLHYVDKQYKSLRHSLAPVALFASNKIIGCLPSRLIPPADGIIRSTCILSNFPGPSHKIDLFGYDVLDFCVGANSIKGFGFGSIVLSYDGKIRFIGGAEQCNLPDQEDVDFLIDSFAATLSQLEEEMEYF